MSVGLPTGSHEPLRRDFNPLSDGALWHTQRLILRWDLRFLRSIPCPRGATDFSVPLCTRIGFGLVLLANAERR